MSAIDSETLYDKLDRLAVEIRQGVINLSKDKVDAVQDELDRLKELSFKQKFPETVYNIMLFRKYAEVANDAIDERKFLNAKSEFPIFSDTNNNEKLLVGLNAAKTNVFWFRLLTGMFAWISFVVMSSVPHIDDFSYSPGESWVRVYFFN